MLYSSVCLKFKFIKRCFDEKVSETKDRLKKISAFHSKNLSEVEFCFGGTENSDRNLFKMAAAETETDSDAGIRPPTCPVRFFSLKSVDWLPVIHPQLFVEHFDGEGPKKESEVSSLLPPRTARTSGSGSRSLAVVLVYFSSAWARAVVSMVGS